MIRTQHKKWADFIFQHYLNSLFRKHFHSMNILGDLPKTDPQIPLLLLPNHSTWWDGFFVYALNKKILHRELYLMMLEKQLQHFSFFAKVGAYSIDPDSLKGVKNSLEYTQRILKEKKNAMICLFAQGVLSPWFKRPLEFQRGLETIMTRYGKRINILPLGMKAIFLEEQHAHVFFRFGTCEQIDVPSFQGALYYERKCEQLLDQIINSIQSGERGEIIFSGAQSLSTRADNKRDRLSPNLKE